MRIIIVEEGSLAREMARDIEGLGQECTVVETAEEYRKMDKSQYDFAIVDLSLPDASPIQTIDTVARAGLPAVLVTDMNDDDINRKAGMAGYVVQDKSGHKISGIIANVIGLAARDKERMRKLCLVHDELEKITTGARATEP